MNISNKKAITLILDPWGEEFIGHLFQDRYHPEFIKSDEQMLEVSRYIHLNPVKANMVVRPEEYKWSSYGMYIGETKEKLINSDKVLSYFKDDVKDDYKDKHKIQRDYLFDFEDVQGQESTIEYIVAAAAGGHNIIMSGSPGCGKSMIAKRIPTILPSMTEEELY